MSKFDDDCLRVIDLNDWVEIQCFLHLCHCMLVWVQSRGFKTLRSKTRRMESGYDGPVASEAYTPAFLKVSFMATTQDS